MTAAVAAAAAWARQPPLAPTPGARAFGALPLATSTSAGFWPALALGAGPRACAAATREVSTPHRCRGVAFPTSHEAPPPFYLAIHPCPSTPPSPVVPTPPNAISSAVAGRPGLSTAAVGGGGEATPERAPWWGHADTLWGAVGGCLVGPAKGGSTVRSLARADHAESATEQVPSPAAPLLLVGARLETATAAARCRRPPHRCARALSWGGPSASPFPAQGQRKL